MSILIIENIYYTLGIYTEKLFSYLGETVFCEHVQERYKSIKENNNGRLGRHSEGSGEYKSHIGICPEKSLSAALDSFDNLFCRRCLVCAKSSSFSLFYHHHSEYVFTFLLSCGRFLTVACMDVLNL